VKNLRRRHGRRVGLTSLPPSVSRMSENVGASTSRNRKGLNGLYGDNFTSPVTLCPPQIINEPTRSKPGPSWLECRV
jgi:hypothetical protein